MPKNRFAMHLVSPFDGGSMSDLSDMLSVDLSNIDPRSSTSANVKDSGNVLVREILEYMPMILNKDNFEDCKQSLFHAKSLGVLDGHDAILGAIKGIYGHDADLENRWKDAVLADGGY